MSETWYRGEVVGAAPTTPGSTAPHDLGDGMYLSDSEDVAKAYAAQRELELRRIKPKVIGGPSVQRVFVVEIDLPPHRVLDLTTDTRWQKHVAAVESTLKTGIGEVYGETFENFKRIYKIDMNQYDAVIGYEYRLGGRQICVVHKNGKPSKIHKAIRRMFKPLAGYTVPTRSWIPKINLNVRAVKMIKGVTVRGMPVLGAIAINVIMSLLQTWLTKKSIERGIKKDLQALQPKIAEKLNDLKPEIAKRQLLLNKGEKVFANVMIEIHWIQKSLGMRLGGRTKYMDPAVRLVSVDITEMDIRRERNYIHEESGCKKVNQYIESFEVGIYTDEELEMFQELLHEYLSYKYRLLMDPYNPVFIEETSSLREKVLEIYGLHHWAVQLDKWTMP